METVHGFEGTLSAIGQKMDDLEKRVDGVDDSLGRLREQVVQAITGQQMEGSGG